MPYTTAVSHDYNMIIASISTGIHHVNTDVEENMQRGLGAWGRWDETVIRHSAVNITRPAGREVDRHWSKMGLG